MWGLWLGSALLLFLVLLEVDYWLDELCARLQNRDAAREDRDPRSSSWS